MSNHDWVYEGKFGPNYWRSCNKCGESQHDVVDIDNPLGFTGESYKTVCKGGKK